MKTLIAKALIVLSVILLSEASVYAHEEPVLELSPIQKAQLLALSEAQITCSAVLVRAFPNEDAIAELGSEIISDALATIESASQDISVESIVELSKSGFEMWDNSSNEGRSDLLKLCGQDLLKKDAVDYGIYMPADTMIFM